MFFLLWTVLSLLSMELLARFWATSSRLQKRRRTTCWTNSWEISSFLQLSLTKLSNKTGRLNLFLYLALFQSSNKYWTLRTLISTNWFSSWFHRNVWKLWPTSSHLLRVELKKWGISKAPTMEFTLWDNLIPFSSHTTNCL